MDNVLLHQLLSTVGVLVTTQLIKRASFIPVNQGQTSRVLAVAGVLSFSANLITAWSTGNLDGFLTPDMINVGVGTAVTWLLAHTGYKTVVKPLS